MMKLKYILVGLLLSCAASFAILFLHECTYESYAIIGEKEQKYDSIVYDGKGDVLFAQSISPLSMNDFYARLMAECGITVEIDDVAESYKEHGKISIGLAKPVNLLVFRACAHSPTKAITLANIAASLACSMMKEANDKRIVESGQRLQEAIDKQRLTVALIKNEMSLCTGEKKRNLAKQIDTADMVLQRLCESQHNLETISRNRPFEMKIIVPAVEATRCRNKSYLNGVKEIK